PRSDKQRAYLRRLAAAKQSQRANRTPPDSVLEVLNAYYLQTKYVHWRSMKYSKRLLELFRDPTTNTKQIATILNKEFQTNAFTKGAVVQHFSLLKRLWNKEQEAWKKRKSEKQLRRRRKRYAVTNL